MTAPFIEAYAWARGDYTVTQPRVLSQCQATEGVTTATGQVAAPTLFLAALKAYTDTFSAVLASGYSRTWDPVTNRITIASDGGAFDLLPSGNLRAAMGMPAATLGATSYAGTSAPLGVVPLIVAEVEAADPDAGAQIDLTEYRHGRSTAMYYANHARYMVRCWVTGEERAALRDGYCTRGRVRINLGDAGNPQGPEHLDGYIDGYVFSAELGTEGDDESHILIALGVAVPEAV